MHFGLDSFHFQSTLLDYEFKTLLNQFQMILNRIYCEYYKFFKIIVKYVTETFADEPELILLCKTSNYPIYKDLEPLKEYDFDVISSLFENIVKIIHYLINMHNNNVKTINSIYSSNDGFNIENYVDTLVFNTAIVNEKIKLYEKYLNVFNKYHICYLSRLDIKLTLLWGQINCDLNSELNKKTSDTDNKYKQMQHDVMINNGLSVKSIKELDNIFSHIGEIEKQNNEETTLNEDTPIITTQSQSVQIHANEINSAHATTDINNKKQMNASQIIEDLFNQPDDNDEYDNILDEIEQNLRNIHPKNNPINNPSYYIIEETHVDDLNTTEPSKEIEPVLQEPMLVDNNKEHPIIKEENAADIQLSKHNDHHNSHHENKLEHIEEQVIHYGSIALNNVVDILDNENLKKKLKKARHKLNVKNKKILNNASK
jgi:hypothetical protein